jgi:soluble lytic murein transglycosylase
MLRAVLLFTLVTTHAFAQPVPPMLQALRRHDWSGAQALAGDPLGAKLVTFIRLLTPDQASAAEIQDFVAANPDWPDQSVLQRRYADALAGEPDETLTQKLCRSHAPQTAPALLHCAEAYDLASDKTRAAAAARAAWIEGDTRPEAEAAFLARWGRLPTQADQRRRFDRLEGTDAPAAARQVLRLDPAYQRLATARLAFRAQDPDALATLAAIPENLRSDPDLLLAEARFLRLTNADQAALTLWQTATRQAEAASPPDRRAAFWTEREILALRLLGQGDAQDAYALADDTSLPSDQASDAAFLAGWIALRALKNPVLARPHFQALADTTHAAISQARALYWLARAADTEPGAQAEFTAAARFPLTYYGQVAARAAGETADALKARIASLQDPAPGPAETQDFDASERVRAAKMLSLWQDPRRAADFLLLLAQKPASATRRTLVAREALREGLPDVAVQTARLAGRDGMALPQSGWPAPVQPPAGSVPRALVLGLMRQESSFDPKIVSRAGAYGLMQVMPQTALQLARATHIPAGPLTDETINMRLGTAYLDSLLKKFGAVPLAIAAYDAGPHRVQAWIDANPAPPPDDTDAWVDWIESIPFTETRSYVQRVLENTEIYAARPN